jgi:hypothetical protein
MDIRRAEAVLPTLKAQIDHLQLEPGVRTNGKETVHELRIKLSSDPQLRKLVEDAIISALTVATILGGNNAVNSSYLSGALQQAFRETPQAGHDLELLLQVAAIPVKLGNSAEGSLFRAGYTTTAPSNQP